MASPAACAQSSSFVAAMRVSTAPRRRPASSFSRVHIPPAARTAPRSLSVSLSVLRPRAHLIGASSDRQSAGDDAGLGFSPCAPAIEDPYDIAASTDLSADGGFVLQGPFVEDPFELATTTGLREGADDEGDGGFLLRGPFVEDPFERVATTGLDESKHDQGDTDLVLGVPTVKDPREVTALVLHVGDPHELTATTDLCVVARDDTGLVLHVPTVEEIHEFVATAGDGAHDLDDDCFVHPSRLTKKEVEELKATDFSPAAIKERFRVESKEAKAAVTGAVAGVLRPLRELLDDLRSLGSVFDAEEFQIGMPFGAIMTCMGMYQLWKLSPSTCIDVAMYYAFYKLSVIAADVRRRGFSPDWIIRIKLGIIIAALAKELGNKGVVPLDFIRLSIFSIYAFSVMWDLKGWKKYAPKCFLPILFHVLITGENLVDEETGEGHVTEETGEGHVTEEMGERLIEEETGESHVAEETGENLVMEETSESHAIEKTSESHVTEETSE